MSDYFGDIRLGETIDIKFTTRQISGAPFTLAGSPVISAYPANSVTQLTAGITLSVDFDSVTGYNNVRVVASGGNGYLTATNYDLCITTGTVNSVSVVGESIGSFSIENRSALMPATAARTLVVDAAGLADANAVKLGPTGAGTAQTARDVGASVLLSSGTGTGQLKLASGYVAMTWADIAAPTTAVNLSGTTIAVTQKVDVDTIKTNPVVNGGTITFPTNATLASTTNITAGTITTVTTVTNQLTAAAIATGVWQDATAGDFTTASSIGKALYVANVVPGAAGGHFIAGTNAATTITTGLTTHFIGTVDTVTTYTGNTPQTGDNFARLGAPVGASISADIAAAPAAVWAVVIDGTNSAIKLMRGFAAALMGKASGLATTSAKYRNTADSKDVIAATVDADGNRSAVTLDLT